MADFRQFYGMTAQEVLATDWDDFLRLFKWLPGESRWTALITTDDDKPERDEKQEQMNTVMTAFGL